MRTQAPDFWNDAKQAEKVMKQVRELKGWIEGCEAVSRSVDDLNVLFDFAKEGEATEEEVHLSGNRRRGGYPLCRNPAIGGRAGIKEYVTG